MRLIDKIKLTEFECDRIECDGNYIIVKLGPYRNYRTRNRDFDKIVKSWRAKNLDEVPITPARRFLTKLFKKG
jgi:hypothetical protein